MASVLLRQFHYHVYLRVAFLIEINVVVKELHKELDLSGGIHALVGNTDCLLEALQDPLLIMQLKTKPK